MPRMIKHIIKNLLSKPVTIKYPNVKPKPMQGTRGKIRFYMVRCDQCQDCERVCPSLAIKVFTVEKKIEYNPFRCIYCHNCVENCMQRAIIAEEVVSSPEYRKTIEIVETND